MKSIELTIEQQFKLKVLETHIQGLNQQQAQKLLVKFVQIGMIKDNIISNYTDVQSINLQGYLQDR
ncbi:NblA/ycf18 family protein [aff. Roholtiella sp. LEGE 12411]|uniref:NblA/ycf18 family protein n=1 Tax=aff. Roholtiella sp. LEGE 12411 TaxID=1828822 RepID=UPI00187FF637|nr:NblA/ycf18 family protein [aff. Roholtiella sp. LEGE 12411]MBE9034369.1 NblA/ycf18 family protein [aff. Roholtiella sp. LEGE 12411]